MEHFYRSWQRWFCCRIQVLPRRPPLHGKIFRFQTKICSNTNMTSCSTRCQITLSTERDRRHTAVLSTVDNRMRASEPVVTVIVNYVDNTCGMTPKSNKKRASFLSQWRYSCLLPRDARHSAAYAVVRSLSRGCHARVVRYLSRGCHARVCISTSKHILALFTILNLSYLRLWQYFHTDPRNRGLECRRGIKNRDFSTNVLLYLGNETRYGHSYYRAPIGTRM